MIPPSQDAGVRTRSVVRGIRPIVRVWTAPQEADMLDGRRGVPGRNQRKEQAMTAVVVVPTSDQILPLEAAHS
ncbi:hypothetical protein [Microbacterium sp. GXF0217]